MTLYHPPASPSPARLLTGEYALSSGAGLRPVRGPGSARAGELYAEFRRKVLAPEFSCVAAKASVNTNAHAFGLYGDLGSSGSSLALAHDLNRFVHDQDALDSDFTSMVAAFDGPAALDERGFEARLWQQLRALHALDTAPYSPEVSADPRDPRFGFSFAGRGFFVIGLHPGSSRLGRTFPVPVLVFNAHRQFQKLRDTGRFERMQQTIRARELKWQGSLNPNLANYGEAPEARQYSGRAVEADWVAPFPSLAARVPDPGAAQNPGGGRCPFGFDTPVGEA